MRKKRFLSILLAFCMPLGIVPSGMSAQAAEIPPADDGFVFTEEDEQILQNDVFAEIRKVEAGAAKRGTAELTEKDYAALVPRVIEAVEASDTYVQESLQRNGDYLVWETTLGVPCCYDPVMEAKLHGKESDPQNEGPADMEQLLEELSALETETPELRGAGQPASKKIGLIQPYWESDDDYADESFTYYSKYYKQIWEILNRDTSSTGMRYSMQNATIDNLANTIEDCGLVMIDSHGATDYYNSNDDRDCFSRANTSYVILTSSSGITSTDTQWHDGEYGRYPDAVIGSDYTAVNGQCIANHMDKSAQSSLLYMASCLSMATDKIFAPMRDKGVEVVWGYSDSVTFYGEALYMASIMSGLEQRKTFAESVSAAKEAYGYFDPGYAYAQSYTVEQAAQNFIAFPICVSDQDAYPGRANANSIQTVNSNWTLFDKPVVYAEPDSPDKGSVTVDGYTITATPKYGYYVTGYDILSGRATVEQDGNKFYVTPYMDCRIRINFAEKNYVTVTCIDVYGHKDSLKCYENSSVKLPPNAPSVDGWTFDG